MIPAMNTLYKGCTDSCIVKIFTACILGFIVLLLSCTTPEQVKKPADQQIYGLADSFVKSYFNHFPELTTLRGIPEPDHRSISVPSQENLAKWEKQIDSLYVRFRQIDSSQLNDTQSWVTYGYLEEELETNIRARICREELWDVDQINGWQVGVSNLASIQPVGTDSLRDAALQRFGSLPNFIDAHILNLRLGLEKGYTSPRESVKRVLEQLELLLESSPVSSPLYDPARRDSTPAFQEAFARLIGQTVNPAIERYRNFLESEYLPEARTQAGIWANPNGAACYRARLREHTTLNHTPEEIHNLGLRIVETLRVEMRDITQIISDTTGVQNIQHPESPTFFSSRSEVLETVKSAVEKARTEMPNWFGTLPRTHVEVVPMPSYLEASGPGGRYLPANEDGSRSARFQINLNNLNNRSLSSLEKLTFHETIPGHHLQRAIALERSDIHPITRYFGYDVFNEGWALYAEALADEMGIYTSDRARLIMLRSQLLNAEYLVLDTGLHYLGWTRQQAIDYLTKQMGGRSDNIARIIDHIIIWPGQTLSYMVGYQEIQRLRKLAKEELGDGFDIVQFHDLVLSDGSIPLHMLRQKVENWISSR